jgi:glutathione S-transferase
MITLYGTSKSRASRSMVALEELGLSYTHVPVFQNGMTAADREILARLNPNGRVPVLDDDGFIVWESMAINLYLADRYGGALWPDGVRERGLVLQWSFWVQAEMDRRDWQKVWRNRDTAQMEVVHGERLATLGVLNAALTGRDYLIADDFTFADLNVAATICQPNEMGKIDGNLDPAEHDLPALTAWLKRCVSRKSWMKLRDSP